MDLKLKIVKEKKDINGFCAYFDNPDLKGLIVECDDINKIPEELAKSIEAYVKFLIENDKFESIEYDLNLDEIKKKISEEHICDFCGEILIETQNGWVCPNERNNPI
jgi:rubrerythrin